MSTMPAATLPSQRNVWIALVCANTAAPAFQIWEYYKGTADSKAALLGIAFALVILNSVLLWALFARSERKGWRLPKKKLRLAAGAMAIVAFLVTVCGVLLLKQRNNYFDLAISGTPLSSINPERTRLVVELIRRSAANSQEVNQAMAEAQKVPLNPAAYSPDSFGSPEIMHSTLAHLAAYAEIDFEYFEKQQTVREDFHRKMAVCDPEYLKNWDAERSDYENIENSANRLEHDWFTSVEALYTYAEQHSHDINIEQGKISISNTAVRQHFDDLFDRSKALHEKLESTVQEEVKHQQQAKAHVGA